MRIAVLEGYRGSMGDTATPDTVRPILNAVADALQYAGAVMVQQPGVNYDPFIDHMNAVRNAREDVLAGRMSADDWLNEAESIIVEIEAFPQTTHQYALQQSQAANQAARDAIAQARVSVVSALGGNGGGAMQASMFGANSKWLWIGGAVLAAYYFWPTISKSFAGSSGVRVSSRRRYRR